MDPRRRRFLRHVAAASASAVAAAAPSVLAQPALRTVAILGDSARGGFGHDMDLVFAGRHGLGDVVVADPDPAGRAAAARRAGAVRSYADWRDLLHVESPWLVCIGMRHATVHHEIAMAALAMGAHLYVEKPFVVSPAEADAILALARARQRRVVVAHSMRMAPAVVALHKAVKEGRLGELREMRAHGKQDARAGGEDLVVLGTHLFDLMRLFAGDPAWLHASVQHGRRPITLADRRRVRDDVGWVAGDAVHATLGFAHGVHALFSSDAAAREARGHWGLELTGSLGSARIMADLVPRVLVRMQRAGRMAAPEDPWTPLANIPSAEPSRHNVPLVDDWLAAIQEGREPECSGRNGAWAVEMAAACHASALGGTRVTFPLARRAHPLDDTP